MMKTVNHILSTNIFKRIQNRWSEPAGYREILTLAIPLILSTASWSMQHFVDRVFLTWLSAEAIAAAMPAGFVNFTLMSLFIGTASYTSTFVAQYSGADMKKQMGAIVWQGLYFAGIAGVIILPFFKLAPMIFKAAGHPPEVQVMEIEYFRVLLWASIPLTASSALAGFFSGRGKTWTVLWATTASTFSNIILDYLLIFGHWGFPGMGIRGAALATVISQIVRAAIYLILIVQPKIQAQYQFLKSWKPDKALFSRLCRFGLPSGLHMLLDTTGFTLFILIVGKFGTVELAATNITLNLSSLAFMPMIGLGMAISIIVGQNVGKKNIRHAEKATWSTFHLTFLYMITISVTYVLFPELYLKIYAMNSSTPDFAAIAGLSCQLLQFVALYSIFDTMNIVFAAAVKGAGDTRFVMWLSIILSWTVMVIPSYLMVIHMGKSIFFAWGSASLFIMLLGITFLLRFLNGRWKTMRVIEESA